MNAFVKKLLSAQKRSGSLVCVGLDSDFSKLPQHLKSDSDPVLAFNKAIINATAESCCSYKPNLAFYEALGSSGYGTLKQTLRYIPENVPVILDAKRGDIGNTASKYAESIFGDLDGDAVTLSPYLGFDSIKPFLEYESKFAFVLAVTSNQTAEDFQYLQSSGKPLYMHVVDKVNSWNSARNLGLVVGAPRPEQIDEIRRAAPNLPFLIPGIGAQGGDLEKAVRYGTALDGIIAINISRGVIFASQGEDFVEKAQESLSQFNSKVDRIRRTIES
jgi:orotidine-5'-phosphate decarboxylase